MYLVDTDVISEARKGDKANAGVQEFFQKTARDDITLHLSVITIGEMRQGAEIIRHRGDKLQADRLDRWLDRVTTHYAEAILPFDEETAHLLGLVARTASGKSTRQTDCSHSIDLRSDRRDSQYCPLPANGRATPQPILLTSGFWGPATSVKPRPLSFADCLDVTRARFTNSSIARYFGSACSSAAWRPHHPMRP